MELLSIEVFKDQAELFKILKSISSTQNLLINQLHLKFYLSKVKLSELLTLYNFRGAKTLKLTIQELIMDIRVFEYTEFIEVCPSFRYAVTKKVLGWPLQ